MSRYVQLKVDYDDDWTIGDTFSRDGVMLGFVRLIVRGQTILEDRPIGLNTSAVALARSVLVDHRGARNDSEAFDAQEPLFFCAGAMHNHCGVISDFDVYHADGTIRFSHFYSCDAATEAEFTVPWNSWAREILRFGDSVVRRAQVDHPRVDEIHRPEYHRLREELRQLLRAIRLRMREDQHAL
jgi:hypothetical protein